MKKSFIIFNLITFIIFLIILTTNLGINYDVDYYFSNNNLLMPVSGIDFTELLFKIFSLSGMLIQYYFINKKLSE
ncbi:MAG: hypothetical protein K0Q49_2405 [Haloplasmataceae bacterium]|jgi:hypothetical protein|nr:hypothetical protein [Haloplasmataceae bacterium]